MFWQCDWIFPNSSRKRMKLLAVISKEASLGVIKYFPKLKCGFIKTDKFQNFDIWK